MTNEEKLKQEQKERRIVKVITSVCAIICVISIISACGSSGESAGIWFLVGMLSFFAALFGVIILNNYPDNGQSGSLRKPANASKSDELYLTKLQAMQYMHGDSKMDFFDQATEEWKTGKSNEWQAEKTKKAMVKGAVVGGIIGGDAGAVVGAMVGKEKSKK